MNLKIADYFRSIDSNDNDEFDDSKILKLEMMQIKCHENFREHHNQLIACINEIEDYQSGIVVCPTLQRAEELQKLFQQNAN